MKTYSSRINRSLFQQNLIKANLAEYGKSGNVLNFITPEKAESSELERANLLGRVINELQWVYKQTKPFLNDLSPGCRLCGEGGWSCLFINGKCNCRCFYCPSPQDDISMPTTNHLTFNLSDDYASYINHFGFKGVSFSGGEPLLTFDRTLDYIRTVRANCPENIHIWMYTNGTLLTPDRVMKLKDAGLKEIRFDIGATDYDLKKLYMAVDHIPVVTVEIPAVPEDFDRLLNLIPVLWDSGVNYLNLHQLRLTPHNRMNLKSRNYTFLHGEKVTVLESELAVLNLFERAIKKNWALPINYCSFSYKHQFQRAAARKRSAAVILKPFESISENGFIRTISLTGEPEKIIGLGERISIDKKTQTLFQISGNKSQLFLHESLLKYVDLSEFDMDLTYSEAVLRPSLSYRYAFKEIRLEGGMKLFVEKQNKAIRMSLDVKQAETFYHHVVMKDRSAIIKADENEWLSYEFIREGLQNYF